MSDHSESPRRSGLETALSDFVFGSGARMAALMDPSGALLAQNGFGSPAQVADLASLAAGLHASSRRLGQMTGAGTLESLVALGGDRRLTVQALAGAGGAVLLLSVFERDTGREGMAPAVDALQGALQKPRPRPETDGDLEASLLQGVERAFAAE